MQCMKCANQVPPVCPHCYSKLTVETVKRKLAECEQMRDLAIWLFDLARRKNN
jgi:hypothetical protein